MMRKVVSAGVRTSNDIAVTGPLVSLTAQKIFDQPRKVKKLNSVMTECHGVEKSPSIP